MRTQLQGRKGDAYDFHEDPRTALLAGVRREGANLILFEVNGIHNIVHLASGALGLALWRNPASARLFALGFGAVYLLVTVLGFAMGTNVLGIIPINAADNVLHLTIAAVGLVAGLASRTVAEPTMSARA